MSQLTDEIKAVASLGRVFATQAKRVCENILESSYEYMGVDVELTVSLARTTYM